MIPPTTIREIIWKRANIHKSVSENGKEICRCEGYPQGWKIDGQIATSQNQQFENDNIAIIESDNIHEGVITIRPINLCASNLK